MNAETLPKELTRYLKRLDTALADAPAGAREEILDDVQGHVLDAIEQGRTPAEALAGLGDVDAAAGQYRAELGLPEESPANAERASRILWTAAALVGALGGWLLAFETAIAGEFFGSPRTVVSDLSARTLVERYGAFAAVLASIPMLLAVLPLVAPRRLRLHIGVTVALVLAILVALFPTTVGVSYLPLAVCAWAAVVVPWRVAHGLDLATSPLWRLFGGLLAASPGLALIGLGAIGMVRVPLEGMILALVFLLLGGLFGVGLRAGYYAVVLLGVVIMLYFCVFGMTLNPLIWWVGGMYLVIGLTAIATLRPRRRGAVS